MVDKQGLNNKQEWEKKKGKILKPPEETMKNAGVRQG